MKKSFLLFLLACITAGTMHSQNGARIEYKLTGGKGMTGTMKIFYSTPGSRTEMSMVVPQMPGGGMLKTSIIKNDKPTTIYMLDDNSKTYTSMEVPPAPPANNNSENITVKVIGKEKVGNYNCTHSVVTRGTSSSDYWTTTEIGDYEKYNKSSKNKFGASDAEQAALVKNNAAGFIVKSITKDPRGSEITMELVKFEKKDIPASMFEIPADYKASAAPTAPAIDAAKLQSMTPEERAKYIEELKKQYGAQSGGK